MLGPVWICFIHLGAWKPIQPQVPGAHNSLERPESQAGPAALTNRKPSPPHRLGGRGQSGCCVAAKEEQTTYSLTQLLSQGCKK
jgi:hypothetical protein